ncbi:MAG: SUMF1/EgtB/PvdO family nonheme iron enzyme [Myxococcales bacterium]|nr:SUMF1/EgtB/PvdO family nonheme iron enzyme [Myxococcales bacterium]
MQCPNSRVLLTCREAAVRDGAEPAEPFLTVRLQPLDETQQRTVATRWLVARLPDPAEAAADAERLLADLSRHQKLAAQSGTPLILALICLVFFRDKQLPDSRVDLYHHLIELFLSNRKRDDRDPKLRAVAPHVRRALLGEIAWKWWHEATREGSRGEDEALLEEDCIQLIINDPTHGQDRATAEALVRFFDERAAMLEWRAVDPISGQRRLRFAHRTFAEYLVACRLCVDAQARAQHLTERYARDDQWREVFEMFTARLVRAEAATPTPAWDWLRTLGAWARDDKRNGPDRAAFARLAAECLAPCRDRPPPDDVIEAVDGLQALFLDADATRALPVPAVQRVGFWNAIGCHARWLRDVPRWVEVPPGRYWRGATPGDRWADSDEKPAGWVQLSRFFIQRWPVLVCEYDAFIAAKGYETRALWSDAGWRWRVDGDITRPNGWFVQRQGRPTHPVVGVSYWEAEAYARWLSQTTDRPMPGDVRLPTEAQWEGAARGPDTNNRRYPWGHKDDPDRRNGEEHHRGTTPLGAFPGGESPTGAWELSGNVWEWCRDARERYSQNPAPDPFAAPANSAGLLVLRGGAWWFDPRSLRVAYRDEDGPRRRVGVVGFRCVCAAPGP